jgi:hypothetical protein
MFETVLAFLGSMFAKIFAEVLKDVLKTPAKEVEITEARGDVDIKPTPVDELITDYRL